MIVVFPDYTHYFSYGVHIKYSLCSFWSIWAYCKFRNFRENFIFANNVKRDVCCAQMFKMHLSPQWLWLLYVLRQCMWFYCCWFIVDCYSHCGILQLLYVLLCVALRLFKFCNILDGEERSSWLLFLSSWCLVIVVWLFLMAPLVCLQFVIVVFPDHIHLPFSKFVTEHDSLTSINGRVILHFASVLFYFQETSHWPSFTKITPSWSFQNL